MGMLVREETTTSVSVSSTAGAGAGAGATQSLRHIVEPIQALGLVVPQGHFADDHSVGSFTVQSSEVDDASGAFSFAPDAHTAHLLQSWGAEKVHSERHDAHLSTTKMTTMTTSTQSHTVTHAHTQVVTSVSTSASVRVNVDEASKGREVSSNASLGTFDSNPN
jgi:hypothetical protein